MNLIIRYQKNLTSAINGHILLRSLFIHLTWKSKFADENFGQFAAKPSIVEFMEKKPELDFYKGSIKANNSTVKLIEK